MKTSKILFIITIVMLSGCTNRSLLDKYPVFDAKKEFIENFSLLTDLMIVKEGKKDTVIIDINNNRNIGANLSTNVKDLLYNKGYAVGKVIPTSVGQFCKGDLYAKTIENESQQNLKYEQLPLKKAPFYYEGSDYDSLLTKLFTNNDTLKTQHNETVNEANLNPIIVILISGQKVSAAKTIREGLLTALATLGTVSIYSVSYFIIQFYIIDSQTSEVLWYDWYYRKDNDPNLNNLTKGIHSIIDKIPVKQPL